jgi:hypothetical protein
MNCVSSVSEAFVGLLWVCIGSTVYADLSRSELVVAEGPSSRFWTMASPPAKHGRQQQSCRLVRARQYVFMSNKGRVTGRRGSWQATYSGTSHRQWTKKPSELNHRFSHELSRHAANPPRWPLYSELAYPGHKKLDQCGLAGLTMAV